MQPSSLWRCGAVLPCDDDVRLSIESWNVEPDAAVEYLPFGDELEELRLLGLFDELNTACSILIDEHEEEWLPVSQVEAALQVVDQILSKARSPAVRDSLRRLAELIQGSRASGQPVLFVL